MDEPMDQVPMLVSSEFSRVYSMTGPAVVVRYHIRPILSDLVGSYRRREGPTNKSATTTVQKSRHLLSSCMVRYEQPRGPCTEASLYFRTIHTFHSNHSAGKDLILSRDQNQRA